MIERKTKNHFPGDEAGVTWDYVSEVGAPWDTNNSPFTAYLLTSLDYSMHGIYL